MSLRDDLEERFLEGDVSDPSSGTSIDWSALSLGIVASVILSVVVGFAESIMALARWLSTSLGSLADWILGLGTSVGGIVATSGSAAASSWSGFVSVLGPAAYPISVAAAVVMFYLIIRVVQ